MSLFYGQTGGYLKSSGHCSTCWTPFYFKITPSVQSFLPFWSKQNLSIRSCRRRRLVGHIDCRKDTSVHNELRRNKQSQSEDTTTSEVYNHVNRQYSRIWHCMPCHPGVQWQVLDPTHSPPFRHFCRQLAEGQNTRLNIRGAIKSQRWELKKWLRLDRTRQPLQKITINVSIQLLSSAYTSSPPTKFSSSSWKILSRSQARRDM